MFEVAVPEQDNVLCFETNYIPILSSSEKLQVSRYTANIQLLMCFLTGKIQLLITLKFHNITNM